LRILLVEDEPLIAIDLEGILDRLGHEVVGVADTCDEAISIARRMRPDAALIDVKLRDGFTGIEAAHRLRDDFGLCCAFVTGNPEQVASGDIAIVAKPYTAANIEAILPSLHAS
jgi:CheY-like chemotaxis protein